MTTITTPTDVHTHPADSPMKRLCAACFIKTLGEVIAADVPDAEIRDRLAVSLADAFGLGDDLDTELAEAVHKGTESDDLPAWPDEDEDLDEDEA